MTMGRRMVMVMVMILIDQHRGMVVQGVGEQTNGGDGGSGSMMISLLDPTPKQLELHNACFLKYAE